MKKHIANIITSCRILFSICMYFFPVFSVGFYSTYTLCGFTDMVDGIIARNTNTVSEFGIRYHGLHEGADASFFLCKELIPGYLNGITGEYGPPEVYLFPEEEAEEFDKKFPCKEKLKLPGQLF